jgi:hypothetical protein
LHLLSSVDHRFAKRTEKCRFAGCSRDLPEAKGGP